jgi:protein N-terminal methyltransferase
VRDVDEKMETETSATQQAIDHKAAIEYWSSISADNDGVLGGYPQVSRIDLASNARFLTKLRRKSPVYSGTDKFERVVDCGAGIGRVTKGFLSKIALTVDIVEPVQKLTDVITIGDDFKDLRESGVIGNVYNVGLEDWTPSVKYDIIWIQWCLGQLTDAQLVALLERLKPWIKTGGWIVVKENQSTEASGEDIFDETDNSLSRTNEKFKDLFKQAKMVLLTAELQNGFPKDLLPVRTYALQPSE